MVLIILFLLLGTFQVFGESILIDLYSETGRRAIATGVKCSPHGPEIPEYGYLEDCTEFFSEDQCMAQCSQGYHGGSRCYVCNEDGKWEPCVGTQGLECIPADCGALIVDFIAMDCPSTTYEGDDCHVQLLDELVSYKCDWDGIWKQKPTGCPAEGPQIPHYGYLDNCFDFSIGGEVCIARCSPGYHGGSRCYKCNEDGDWVTCVPNQSWECHPVDCGTLIVDSVAIDCPSTTYEGDDCDVYEDETHLAAYMCDWDGVWKEKFPTVSPTVAPTYAPSTTAPTTTRAPTYTPAKYPTSSAPTLSPTAVCSAEGPQIPDYGYLDECIDFFFADVCKKYIARCSPGYHGGSRCYKCNEDGEWETCVDGDNGANELDCTPVDCGTLTIHSVAIDHCSSTTYEGDDCDVQLSCDGGVQLVSHTCDWDGVWKQTTNATNCVHLSKVTVLTKMTVGDADSVASVTVVARAGFAQSVGQDESMVTVTVIEDDRRRRLGQDLTLEFEFATEHSSVASQVNTMVSDKSFGTTLQSEMIAAANEMNVPVTVEGIEVTEVSGPEIDDPSVTITYQAPIMDVTHDSQQLIATEDLTEDSSAPAQSSCVLFVIVYLLLTLV